MAYTQSPINFGEGTGAKGKPSPLNQVRGQQVNPSTLKSHIEHGTGIGGREGKGPKPRHMV